MTLDNHERKLHTPFQNRAQHENLKFKFKSELFRVSSRIAKLGRIDWWVSLFVWDKQYACRKLMTQPLIL